MSSVYENKFDVIFRKLQNEKDQLKKDFDSAYSKDDFHTSMGIMEEIQEVMNKLSALDSVEKPFKQMSQIADRVDDLKTEIEIHLEELGKQIKAMDELQELISGELETPMQTLRDLFTKEVERNFTFEFDKFSDDELMTLIHYRKSNFPSRIVAYESYWNKLVHAVVDGRDDIMSTPSYNVNSSTKVDLDVPLSVTRGESLRSNCYLDVRDESGEVVEQEKSHADDRAGFDHGVEDLSEFQRRNSIPMLTDAETSRILGSGLGSEGEPEVISDQTADGAITAQEIEQYENELSSVEEPLQISVEEIEEDVMLDSISKVESLSEISPDEDFAVSVDDLDSEIVATTFEAPDNIEAEYSEGEYAEAEYSEIEYAEAEYSESEYAEAEYSESEYAEAEYSEGEYAEAEYSEGGYEEAEYSEGEYASGDEYAGAEHDADEHFGLHHLGESNSENQVYAEEDYEETSSESFSEKSIDDDLPLDDLSEELEIEEDQNVQHEPLDIDSISLDETDQDNQINSEDEILDIDDIEIDLDSSTSLSLDLEDEILDLDYSEDTTTVPNDLEDELDLDDIEINLDEE